MSDLPKHPAAFPPAPAPAAEFAGAGRSRSRQSNLRYVVAGAMFVVIVGVIAWVTQFTPRRSGPIPPTPIPPPMTGPLRFAYTKPVWDKDDDEYALEQEQGKEGHADFPFENKSAAAAQLGLMTVSCDCSYLEVALPLASEWENHVKELHDKPQAETPTSWTWTKLARSETEGFKVPPGAKGMLRVNWHGRRGNGHLLNLAIKIWHQPEEMVGQRNFEDIKVAIRMASPVRFTPVTAAVGTLSAHDTAVVHFTLWSATRDEVAITFGDQGNPLFTPQLRKFSPQECRELEKELRTLKKENTRIILAYELTVKVQEQAGGKQLDQGPFRHALTMFVDGDKAAEPTIWGTVKGDIVMGNSEDGGKIDLKTFRAKEGAALAVFLWTDDQIALQVENQTPPTLDAKLAKLESKGKRAKWQLEVTVPPDTQFGAFSAESVIILRTQTNPPRFIRIPVIGNGQS
jgi:hypothetical protein